MTNALKVIAAIIFHLNTHNESATESLRRLLPRNPEIPLDESVLASGMTAGIYIDVFEIGEQADYPGDVVQTPIKRVAAPADVLKVKYVILFSHLYELLLYLCKLSFLEWVRRKLLLDWEKH